jgi:outer membrane protein OmpA-like peptidoglycan-associated protein/ABC-type nitrate/sulfonate/bicarbonate transport system substrate-binding protein
MSAHIKIAFVILIFGLVSLIGWRFALPLLEDSIQLDTSDAKSTRGKIRIGYDNWVGYFPLCSPDMKKRLRGSGYLLECLDDAADYSTRFAALKDDKLDFAVATVDSYVLNGEEFDYPGTIIAALDESKGGDAIVAWEDRIKTLDDFKSSQLFKIALTTNSPSDHFLKAVAVHFDVPQLRNRSRWLAEAQGSSDALKMLLGRRVDAAVLWEPDVSRALGEKGLHRIIGTEDTNQLIVDILLVNRRFSSRHPEAVEIVLRDYFKTLKFYRDNPDKLVADIADASGLDKTSVQSVLKGVAWSSLTDNAQRWFGGIVKSGVPEEALLDTIESAISILIDYGDIKRNPLPNEDPYRITNSEYIKVLHEKFSGLQVFNSDVTADQNSISDILNKPFTPLSDQNWNNLREIGTLKVRPIMFASGASDLALDGKLQLDEAAENLKHYPNYRLEIRGHTGMRGDASQNKILSSERADAVKRYLIVTYGIDENRMRPIGFGGERPLHRQGGENQRAYNYRLPRVELVLMAEEI